jgi:hypothetical protein
LNVPPAVDVGTDERQRMRGSDTAELGVVRIDLRVPRQESAEFASTALREEPPTYRVDPRSASAYGCATGACEWNASARP